MRGLAFALVFTSAFVHATWNTAIRGLKGNTPVLVFAHFIGTVMSFPVVVYLDGDFYHTMVAAHVGWIYLASSIVHALYIILLSTAYIYGDVGLVYPLARGTAIVLSTWGSQAFTEGEGLNSAELGGVAVVVLGIFGLFIDASRNAMSKVPVVAYAAVPASEQGENNGGDVELVPAVVLEPPEGADDEVACNIPQAESQTASESSAVRQLLVSIGLALCVGCCTASYSILDSLGVQQAPALTWSFAMNALSIGMLLPFLLLFYKDMATEAITDHWKVIIMIAPFTVGAYLIVLFVFSFPDVNVALVVTLREFAVLVGATFGVLFLGERCTILKFASILCMLAGMLVIKVA